MIGQTIKLATGLVTEVASQTLGIANTALSASTCLTRFMGDIINNTLNETHLTQEQKERNQTIKDYGLDKLINMNQKKILECSSKGDKRFSALYASINFLGEYKTIEEHYQASKLIGNQYGFEPRDVKGKQVNGCVINGNTYHAEYLTPLYYLLWFIYLETNPELVEYAKQYDEFTDSFKGKAINSQADCIRTYVNNYDYYKQAMKEFAEKLND